MIRLEVLSLVPTSFKQGPHCETLYGQSGIGEKVQQEIMQEYPPDLLQDHKRLSDWVLDLSVRYGSRIQIRVIDPQSGIGFLKSLRYRVRRYPTFIVNGKAKYTGWDKESLETLLQDALATGHGTPPFSLQAPPAGTDGFCEREAMLGPCGTCGIEREGFDLIIVPSLGGLARGSQSG